MNNLILIAGIVILFVFIYKLIGRALHVAVSLIILYLLIHYFGYYILEGLRYIYIAVIG